MRKVFFSFHYDRDIWRVNQVRNSWIIRNEKETQPFLDKADWESKKRAGDQAIKNWISDQLNGASVTVVLIGAETSNRKWVTHEIKESYRLKKGLLGIYINNIQDSQNQTDHQGTNPFGKLYIGDNDNKKYLSEIYQTYDWVAQNGRQNISQWIEEAARNAGR
ncbi:MAG: TIR-like domain-containing protein [Gammaproteobacteria bacterium]|nr:MAG: TIR-like domain-containing protein [Gammaproteobacteria bacterium]